ncbi:hypothetical protein [Paraoerskovia sediminicola]
MQLRVVSITLVVGVVSVAVLGAFLSESIRDGLFKERLSAVDAESARSTAQARTQFEAANPQSSSAVQQLLTDMVLSLQSASAGTRDVFLWRPEGETSTVVDVSTADRYGTVITPEMREATLATADAANEVPQVLQSVAIEIEPGRTRPSCRASWSGRRSTCRARGPSSSTTSTRSSRSRRRSSSSSRPWSSAR